MSTAGFFSLATSKCPPGQQHHSFASRPVRIGPCSRDFVASFHHQINRGNRLQRLGVDELDTRRSFLEQQDTLIAVGDRTVKVAWFSLSCGNRAPISWHTKSIAKLSGSQLPKHDPQLEAVCADGAERDIRPVRLRRT